ncbi:MAG: DUF1476 domain-containing protein [Hyphomicrobiaceae bacterium]
MSTFDEREKGFEKKFAHDQELQFKAESRRNKMIGEWAAAKLGLTDAELDNYVKAVRRADLEEAGDEDVVRKISKDFADSGVPISDDEIRSQLSEFFADAVRALEAS